MPLTYSQYVTSLANLLVVPPTNADFTTVLPNIIDDAEQRLYRELDLLNTVTSATATTSINSRSLTLPTTANGPFVVTDSINIVTSEATGGTQHPLVPASKEMLDSLWPNSVGSTIPIYWAPVTQNTVVFGPWPDQAYQADVTGTIRPQALSATNTTTLLSVYFPDLMIAASMVFGAAYLKNFGAAVDDPKMAITWEGHLQELLKSAQTEEQRKKFNMAGWSSKQPAPSATPPRV